MYSKFGRQTLDRFLILGKREEILKDKCKKFAIKRIPFSFHKDHMDRAELQELIQNRKSVRPKKKRGKSSWTFLARGRDAGVKSCNESPPVGHYNCKYDQVQPRAPYPNMELRPRTHSRVPKKEKKLSIHTPDKPRAHIPSPVPFDKQIPRQSSHRSSASAILEPNFFYCKKQSASPDFSKTLGRNPKLFENTFSATEYNVKYDLVSKQTRKAPNFERYSRRKSNVIQDLNRNEYNLNYKLVSKHVKSPKYRKQKKKKESPLPKHMSDCNSRMSLEIISEKTLFMNNRINKSFLS